MSYGLPGPLPTPFALHNWSAQVKSYARCGYTNATCPALVKKAQNIKHNLRTFHFVFKKFKMANLGGVWEKHQMHMCQIIRKPSRISVEPRFRNVLQCARATSGAQVRPWVRRNGLLAATKQSLRRFPWPLRGGSQRRDTQKNFFKQIKK